MPQTAHIPCQEFPAVVHIDHLGDTVFPDAVPQCQNGGLGRWGVCDVVSHQHPGLCVQESGQIQPVLLVLIVNGLHVYGMVIGDPAVIRIQTVIPPHDIGCIPVMAGFLPFSRHALDVILNIPVGAVAKCPFRRDTVQQLWHVVPAPFQGVQI